MRARPLVIFALDAADPALLRRWASAGSLPALARLLAAGTAAPLSSARVVSVHEIWTSVLSGEPLSSHARYANRTLVPGTYRIAPAAPEELGARPFWARLAGGGRRAVVFDAPDAALVRGLPGAQLLGWGGHPTPPEVVCFPDSLLAETRALGERIPTDELRLGRRRDRRILGRILARVARKAAIATHLLAAAPFDLAVVGFGDAHAAGHRFHRYSGLGDRPRDADERLGGALLAVYQAIDRAIDEILRSCPVAPNAIVVSNGGLRDGYPVGPLLRGFCTALGYQAALPASGPARFALGIARRAVPRALEGALPRVWRGALRGEPRLVATDWARTAAFAIPSDYTGYLRVNVAGREPQGIVKPGAEYAATLDRLEADLRALVDESTGESVIERVVRGADLSGGLPDRLPDLFVDWRSRVERPGRIVHPRAVVEDAAAWRARENHHSREGLVVAAGPDLPAGATAEAIEPVDLAPLFLALLGEPAAGPLPEGVRWAFPAIAAAARPSAATRPAGG